MYSLAYWIGMLVGVLCGLAFVALLFWFLKKKYKVNVTEYDERQVLVRGKAYKYGFYTALILMLAEQIAEQVGFLLFDSLEGAVTLLMICLLVFIVVCVWKDAYMTLHETPKMVLIMLAAAGGLNLVIAAANLRGGDPILTDGRLGAGSLNLMVGVFVAAILLIFLWRQFMVRRRQAEE